jgi:hypothetical protein
MFAVVSGSPKALSIASDQASSLRPVGVWYSAVGVGTSTGLGDGSGLGVALAGDTTTRAVRVGEAAGVLVDGEPAGVAPAVEEA